MNPKYFGYDQLLAVAILLCHDMRGNFPAKGDSRLFALEEVLEKIAITYPSEKAADDVRKMHTCIGICNKYGHLDGRCFRSMSMYNKNVTDAGKTTHVKKLLMPILKLKDEYCPIDW